MSFSFNTRISNRNDKSEYAIQIITDNYEQFLFMQDMARECIDGKHKEKKGGIGTITTTNTTVPPVGTLNTIPTPCESCSNHPSNGGSGLCACSAPYISYGVK